MSLWLLFFFFLLLFSEEGLNFFWGGAGRGERIEEKICEDY